MSSSDKKLNLGKKTFNKLNKSGLTDLDTLVLDRELDITPPKKNQSMVKKPSEPKIPKAKDVSKSNVKRTGNARNK